MWSSRRYLRLRPFDTTTSEGRSAERYHRIAWSTLLAGYLPRVQALVRVYPSTKTASGGLSRLDEIERMIRRHGRRSLPRWF